jgi:hypothetical protein
MVESAWAYATLGVEHILAGFDHLMFVLSLLFLVGFNKRLVYTISAFTLAHSLTLALLARAIDSGLSLMMPCPLRARCCSPTSRGTRWKHTSSGRLG